MNNKDIESKIAYLFNRKWDEELSEEEEKIDDEADNLVKEGYLYYRINLDPDKYDRMDILDSLATTILPKAGFQEADLVLHTQYMPEQDPKIIEAAHSFRASK